MQPDLISAFGHRELPSKVTEVISNDELRNDALHFEGMAWTEVKPEDWATYRDAFHGLSPEAFLYFLPSILAESDKRSDIAFTLVAALDTSADPAIWPTWFAERFPMLTGNELQALKDWTAAYIGEVGLIEAVVVARVQDTLTMLELLNKA